MIGAAIVGLGWWGKKLSQSIAESRAIRFVRGVEPSETAVAGFAASCGFPIGTSYEEALADPAVQAVVLATPHALHARQIEQAVAAGRHVFCEKPLALTRAGAERSVALCRGRGLVLGIGHERRYEGPVAEMLGAACAGELGTLLELEANFSHDKFLALPRDNWRFTPENAPAGGMTATGVHIFDLATALFGEGADARATCRAMASDLATGDTSCAMVRYRSGAVAYVAAMLATPFIGRVGLFGSEGWIEIRDKAHVEAPEGWTVIRCRKGGTPEVRDAPPGEPVRANLEAFARAIEGEAPYPIPTDEMIANAAVMEAVIRSAETGRLEPVPA
jgi:predicted dehydrogenase